jgi:hypothetical protein
MDADDFAALWKVELDDETIPEAEATATEGQELLATLLRIGAISAPLPKAARRVKPQVAAVLATYKEAVAVAANVAVTAILDLGYSLDDPMPMEDV